jgi:putative copper resistance protein D
VDPLIAVRAIHYAATALAGGIVFFEWLVAGPSLPGDQASVLLIRFHRRMALVLWVSLAMAVISAGAWLALVASNIVDRPLSEVVRDGTAWTVFTETRFGFDWQVRLLCAALLGGFALTWQHRNSILSGLPAAILAAVFVGALAWAGHGGATPGYAGIVHVSADVLHLVAAAAWLGGLVPLILLLASLGRPDVQARAVIASAICRRFSNLGIFVVVALLVSGLTNAWFLVGDSPGLTGTSYGRLLSLKLLLFLGMVCLAAANRQYLMPRLASAEPGRAALSIARNATLELLLGLAIVAVVAALGITPPATEHHVHIH